MKAEHRKELQTNVLADRLGRLVQGFKSRPSSAVSIVWVFVVAAVAIFIAWWFYWTSAKKQQSALFTKDYTAESQEDLDKIIKEGEGTAAGREARLTKARRLMAWGLPRIGSYEREKALERVGEAGDIYKKLLDEVGDSPVRDQEVLSNLATVKIVQGEWSEALKYYQELAKRYPKTAEGKTAEEYTRRLAGGDPDKEMKEIQDELVAAAAASLRPRSPFEP